LVGGGKRLKEKRGGEARGGGRENEISYHGLGILQETKTAKLKMMRNMTKYLSDELGWDVGGGKDAEGAGGVQGIR